MVNECSHSSMTAVFKWIGIDDKGEYYQEIGFCADCGVQSRWKEYFRTFDKPLKGDYVDKSD